MNRPDPGKRKAKTAPRSASLSLEDTVTQRAHELRAKSTVVGGYDPYDAVPAAKSAAVKETQRKKPTDLRKLSEWLRHFREIDELNKPKP
jgi:hypothetical protein